MQHVALAQLLGATFDGDAAGLDKKAVVGVLQRFLDELLDQQDRQSARQSCTATSRMRLMMIGASPPEGSSRISRRGSPMMPCATAKICCCPPHSRDAA